MITGEMRNKVDSIWDTIWTGGITSPVTVLEQITYLMFMKLLDDNQLKAEANANVLGVPLKNKVFKEGIRNIGHSRSVRQVHCNTRQDKSSGHGYAVCARRYPRQRSAPNQSFA